MDIDLARVSVRAIAAAVDQHKDHLPQLDSAAIGDAGHGINVNRGFCAVTTALGGLAAFRQQTDAGADLASTALILRASAETAAAR